MAESSAQRKAVISLIHSEREAAPFLFGYLLTDISDATLAKAVAAYGRHCAELEQLEQRSDEPAENAPESADI